MSTKLEITLPLSDDDKALLVALLRSEPSGCCQTAVFNVQTAPEAETEVKKPAAAKRAPAKKAAAKPAPEPETEEEDEDLIGDAEDEQEITIDDCSARASLYVKAKRAAEVKKVLTDFSVAKVSLLDESDFAAFLEALPAI